MQLEVHQIPKSIQGYIDQFETDPATAIERLKNHISKRNTGAVGYFFLAWLYHRNKEQKKAVQAAMKAKMLAPGSKLMERLHYHLSHPRSFNAWEPELREKTFQKDTHSLDTAHPIQNLDLLIARLSSVDRSRMKPDPDKKDKEKDLSELSSQVDDIVTETLAAIHERQNNFTAAIETYRKLRSSNPSKKDHYSEEIFRLKQRLEENDQAKGK
jgi:tetratricopeptide (TPR) repeat protein